MRTLAGTEWYRKPGQSVAVTRLLLSTLRSRHERPRIKMLNTDALSLAAQRHIPTSIPDMLDAGTQCLQVGHLIGETDFLAVALVVAISTIGAWR